MSIASFLFPRRRELALCALSVLLHLVALWWIAPRMGPAARVPRREQPAAAIVALLQATPPPPPARPAAAPARPVRHPRPARAAQAPAGPTAPAIETPAEPQGGAAETVASVQSAEPAVAEAAPVQAEPAPAQPDPQPPAAQPHHYQVNMPPSAEIGLDVERRDADGTLWHGEAVMAWKLYGGNYSMKVEAGIRVLVARVNLVVLTSEGRVAETGFAPVTMTEKRRGRALTATHFNDGRITFSASQAAFDLLPGAQDKATVPLQLAAIARGDVAQLDGGIEILVGEDRDASLFRFEMLGQEELATGLGRMLAWHLSRPPRAGAYGSRLDIWLAPAHGWLPVQIRNTEANGAVTTQTASKILLTDSGT